MENAFFRLSKANREGYGVFATINKSSNGGRKAEDICEVRAIFIDIDNDVDNASQRLAEFQLQPHLEICTSPGRLHAYWVVADCSLDDFRAAQIKLSLYFNGDPAICDLPRVMRVPGFYHQKRTVSFPHYGIVSPDSSVSNKCNSAVCHKFDCTRHRKTNPKNRRFLPSTRRTKQGVLPPSL